MVHSLNNIKKVRNSLVMYAYLRKKRELIVDRGALIGFVGSLTALSLLDLLFNSLGLDKGMLFSIIWLAISGSFIYYSYKLLNTFEFEDTYFKYMFFLFLGYGAITVLRGWSFSPGDLTSFLRVPYIFWPFMIPLFALFAKRLATVGFLFKLFFNLGILFLLAALLFPNTLLTIKANEILIYSLVLGPCFLIMNSVYLSPKRLNLTFAVVLLATLSMIYLGRRAGLVLLGGSIIASYVLVLTNKNKPLLFKILPYLLVLGLIIFLKFEGISESLLEQINNRLFEDTRSAVIDMFFLDMDNSQLFGKGMNATYFCPIGGGLGEDGFDYTVTYYRDTIENGYLQLMLSGGIVHIVLFLLLALPAIFNGIFRSNNQLCKAAGIMVLLWLIFMLGSGQPSLSLGYVLVWICIGICYKKSIRIMTNYEIQEGMQHSLDNNNPPGESDKIVTKSTN